MPVVPMFIIGRPSDVVPMFIIGLADHKGRHYRKNTT
jgi:hypothetical protein